jgi:hypothetical protein
MLLGDRKTNIILTKLRHRCSGLNADLHRVNLKNDPRCACGHLVEDATPYRGKRFWTHQIPTSSLPTLLIFIHIEHTFSYTNVC